ncbi:hypothetical protein ANAPH1_00807 [Anaplasma phagocytophilum]|nr:hypothetical protein ANAPH1_00807 [Anaplasma phagocytophilum]
MMLFLDRLITLPLLLPRLLVKISFSLLRLWIFLIPRSVRRFVRRSQQAVKVTMVCMELHIVILVRIREHYVEPRETVAKVVQAQAQNI